MRLTVDELAALRRVVGPDADGIYQIAGPDAALCRSALNKLEAPPSSTRPRILDSNGVAYVDDPPPWFHALRVTDGLITLAIHVLTPRGRVELALAMTGGQCGALLEALERGRDAVTASAPSSAPIA